MEVKNSAKVAPRLQVSIANASYFLGPNNSSGAWYGLLLVRFRFYDRSGGAYPVETSKYIFSGASGHKSSLFAARSSPSPQDIPKSMSWTRPVKVSRMLLGLISRCAILAVSCRNVTALRIWNINDFARRTKRCSRGLGADGSAGKIETSGWGEKSVEDSSPIKEHGTYGIQKLIVWRLGSTWWPSTITIYRKRKTWTRPATPLIKGGSHLDDMLRRSA